MEQINEIPEIGLPAPKRPQLPGNFDRQSNLASSDAENEEKWMQTLRSSEDVLEEMINQAFADDDAGLTRTIRTTSK